MYINEFFLKAIMVATYEYNRSIFNKDNEKKASVLEYMLQLMKTKRSLCPDWFLSLEDSYRKQLVEELYQSYTSNKKTEFEDVIFTIGQYIKCKANTDQLPDSKPEWQKDISKNNLLRAGAKSRSLAIEYSDIYLIKEIKSLVISMYSYSLHEGDLADWQKDMLDSKRRILRKIRNCFDSNLEGLNTQEVAFLTVVHNSIARLDGDDFVELQRPSNINLGHSEFFLIDRGLYYNKLPTDEADHLLIDIIVDGSTQLGLSDFENYYNVECEREIELVQFYLLILKSIKSAELNSIIPLVDSFIVSVLNVQCNVGLSDEFYSIIERLDSKLSDYNFECQNVSFTIKCRDKIGDLLLNQSSLNLSRLLSLFSNFNTGFISDYIDDSQRKLDLIKRDFSKSKCPPVIIRPHLLGGKNTLFDIQYIHDCIESVLLNLDESGTVIFVVNDKNAFDDIVDDRLFVFQFEEFSNPDYYRFIANYKHLSTNPIGFEMFAISSYFYKIAIADLIHAEDVLIVEGDVLILRNIEEFYDLNGEAYLSDGNACCVARLPRNLISHYCNVVNRYYTEPHLMNELAEIYKRRQSKGLFGGICDMTFWDFIKNDKHRFNEGFIWKKAEELSCGSYCDTHFRVIDDLVDGDVIVKKFKQKKYELANSNYEFLIGKEFVPVKVANRHCFTYAGSGKDIIVNSAHFVGGFKQVMVKVWPELKRWLSNNEL